MKKIELINEFLHSNTIAVVGVSRDEKKFGNYVYKNLKKRNYNLIPIHSEMNSIFDDKCFRELQEISDQADAVLVVVNKNKSLELCRQAHQAGLKKIWLQQSSETPEAIKFCSDEGISLVHGECILMYTNAKSFPHNLHGFLWKILGKYPK